MKRVLALMGAVFLTTPAYAQQSSWLWWGTSQNTSVPVSASNPLPVTGGGVATSLVVGTTAITGGTTLGLLYDNAGVLGNLATGNSGVLVTDGSGNPSISTTLPTGLAATSLNLTTPVLGVATGTSLALGSPTGGSIANSVNVAGGFYVNNVLQSSAVGANPTATAGAAAINGSAATFMRSDAAPAVAVMTATTAGLVPTPPNNTTTFLRGDGTFASAGAPLPKQVTAATTTVIMISYGGL